MDNKFLSILALALRPETGAGEAQAALNAARRLVANQGLEKLLGSLGNERVVEKVVYKNRVVYQRFASSHSQILTVTIMPRFQFSMIEKIFQDAVECQVNVEVLSCHGVDGQADQGMVIKLSVTGPLSNIAVYQSRLQGYVDQALKRNSQTPDTGTSTHPMDTNPKKSWWRRIFG